MTTRRLVLVADDELVIQELVVRALDQIGLVALPVGDGAAAIAAVKAQRGDLVCVILDVVMPIMNGVDAAHAIQQIAPELAIVLMSGAIPPHYTDRIPLLRLAGMLDKPFRLATLRALVRDVVDYDATAEKDGSCEEHRAGIGG